EMTKKKNITFHPENSTVSYFQERSWYFDKNLSNGTLEDNITQVNAIKISALHQSRYLPNSEQEYFDIYNSKSNLSIVLTVNELLFTGYKDIMINEKKITAMVHLPIFDRFGWFYKKNGSVDFDGNLNVDTGKKNIRNLGILRKWNHKNTTKYYNYSCNRIEGSTGEFWPPNQAQDDIKLFIPDLFLNTSFSFYRPLTFEFIKEKFIMGIHTSQYSLGEETLGKNMERRRAHEQEKYFKKTIEIKKDKDFRTLNNCYCNGECSPSGLINITSCRYGAPVFVSLPHFYKADPILGNQVVGMNPNEDDHSFYINIEPLTGIPLEMEARLQINMLIESSNNVS
ncbi:protein croquemort-like, partial [Polistes fuscatus]|uniref:protein croquemort-like n=1 Tax=Polistes fuscatus TaxID=30207 RepID=UPI001CA86384